MTNKYGNDQSSERTPAHAQGSERTPAHAQKSSGFATQKKLKNLLKENNVSKTSNNLMTLMMIAIDNGLIDRESIMSKAEEVCVKNPVGRPRKKP